MNNYTVKELRIIAKQKNLHGFYKLKKEDLYNLIFTKYKKRTGSSTSSIRKRSRTTSSRRKQSNNKISILTLNVKAYEDANPDDIYKRILSTKADVVCIQEDLYSNNKKLKGYKKIIKCKAEKYEDDFLSNSIFVKNEIINMTELKKSSDIKYKNSVRCSSLLKIYGITIANVHLTGGRYDDEKYEKYEKAKMIQLDKLVNKYKADVIVGDFNSDSTEDEVKKSLKNYKLYKNLNKKQKDQYINYSLSGHNYLLTKNYTKAYTEKNVRPTSVYGGVPDWFYYKNQILNVLNVKKIEALDVTDHNGILVKINIKH